MSIEIRDLTVQFKNGVTAVGITPPSRFPEESMAFWGKTERGKPR